jgi:hypothetical protein
MEGSGVITDLMDVLFGCVHEHYSWPRTDRRGTYVACLECGRRIPYQWEEMGAVPNEYASRDAVLARGK